LGRGDFSSVKGNAGEMQKTGRSSETVEKLASERLMENVHMQGFRNPEE
jgi:hypothetical protein